MQYLAYVRSFHICRHTESSVLFVICNKMAASLDGIFSDELQNKLKDAKVFVVGAGGIGCELLKNLVLTGFTDIEIIDLDTIDVSNLNRQFLFHKQHVGKSKAAVAAESVLQFNPNVKIKYYHDSVIGPNFNKSFFERFNIVLNALDNLQARFHVNRMCLAAGVPLIESGTSGYTGQVELIKGGLSSCYECLTKTLPKDFPGCTIRNTPSEPIHCIVWAKHLFNQLFGEPDEDVSPDTEDPELAGHAAARVLEELESPDKKGAKERKSTREWAKGNQYSPNMIFNKLFKEDITYLLRMTDLWNKKSGRKAPIPLSMDKVPDSVAGSSTSKDFNGAGLKDMAQWSIAECVEVFKNSVNALKEKLDGMSEAKNLVWDKDDKEAMDFVAACANIRAYIFHIPLKTRFEIKSMAGNIIPAIATTNAIIAGVVVLRALRVLTERYTECASVYLRSIPNIKNWLLVPEAGLLPPNKNCIVCTKPEVVLSCNLDKMKVKELEEILKKNLNMAAPDVLLKTSHSYIISSEEGETEQNNEKTLTEMGVQDGTCLQADDYLQNYKLEISVKQYVAETDQPLFLINSEGADLTPKLAVPEKNGSEKKAEVEDDDDLIVTEEHHLTAGTSATKRKINDHDQGPVPPKKRAYDVSSEDEIVL